MTEPTRMHLYAHRVHRDRRAARARSLARRVAGPLFDKYLEVVPSVFSARGELAAFRLTVPAPEALERLSSRIVLTLDSATELLAGFRFGKARNAYVYLESSADLREIEEAGIGERRPGTSFPLAWTPPGWEMMFAVVPVEMPPSFEHGGHRVVTREHLIRDLIGFYGLRTNLIVEIETKLLGPAARP